MQEARGLPGQPHPQGRRVHPHLVPRAVFRRGGLWGEGETQRPRGGLTAGLQTGLLEGNKGFAGRWWVLPSSQHGCGGGEGTVPPAAFHVGDSHHHSKGGPETRPVTPDLWVSPIRHSRDRFPETRLDFIR